MIEKIKKIQNPLTVIAIFAALAEVAGTVALALVNKDLQIIFIWFVMLFPVLLLILFFITLNFNPKVLYSPSDFQDEENFLNVLIGRKELSIRFEELNNQLATARDQIITHSLETVGTAGKIERERLAAFVKSQIDLIQQKIESTQQSADDLASELTIDDYPHSNLQANILALLSEERQSVASHYK